MGVRGLSKGDSLHVSVSEGFLVIKAVIHRYAYILMTGILKCSIIALIMH